MKKSLIIFFELLRFMQWFSNGCIEICSKLENHDGDDEFLDKAWEKYQDFLEMFIPNDEEFDEFRKGDKELGLTREDLQELRNQKYYSLKEKIAEWIKLLNTNSEADRLLVLSQMNDIIELYPSNNEVQENDR